MECEEERRALGGAADGERDRQLRVNGSSQQLLSLIEEDEGPDDHVLPATGVPRQARVDGGGVEGPAADRAVGQRVVALEH